MEYVKEVDTLPKAACKRLYSDDRICTCFNSQLDNNFKQPCYRDRVYRYMCVYYTCVCLSQLF